MNAMIFVSNQKLKMMRILMMITLLFVCARSVAQTTLISTGEIKLGVQVYDLKNEQLLDISKICDGFNEEGLPIDLVLPYKSQIRLFLPEVTEGNSADYRYVKDDGSIKKVTNFNFEYEGRMVASLGNISYAPGATDAIEVIELREIISILNSNPKLKLDWRVDEAPIELELFIQNDEIDERQDYSDAVMGNLFSSDEVKKSYDYWIDKGFAQGLDENGLPENPIIPFGAGIISFTSNTANVQLLKDGERIDFDRFEARPNGEVATYYFNPDESGSYLVRLIDSRKVYGQTSRTYAFTVPFNFWKEGGYWMIGAIGLLLLAFMAYRIMTKRKMDQNNLLKQLSEAELKAIRSQLNPHFLFNALSAIQNLVNQSKNDEANAYIVKLSKLLRKVLVHSDESMHALQEELELAKLYLELEQLRMPFDYEVIVEESIDQNVLVPGMILQPYLENAIFHGVSKYKASHVQLIIKAKDAELSFEIKDNGQHDTTGFNEGKGMSLGRERIEILKKQVGEEIKASIQTKKDKNGFSVRINLPKNL